MVRRGRTTGFDIRGTKCAVYRFLCAVVEKTFFKG